MKYKAASPASLVESPHCIWANVPALALTLTLTLTLTLHSHSHSQLHVCMCTCVDAGAFQPYTAPPIYLDLLLYTKTARRGQLPTDMYVTSVHLPSPPPSPQTCDTCLSPHPQDSQRVSHVLHTCPIISVPCSSLLPDFPLPFIHPARPPGPGSHVCGGRWRALPIAERPPSSALI